MDKNNLNKIKKDVIKICKRSKIFFTDKEFYNIEITDLGLNDFYRIGISIIVYVNTDRICAKELILIPYQICPQHLHPDIDNNPGKEETFRCRWGEVYLYVSGTETRNIRGEIPEIYKSKFSVFNEIILKPGDQYTLKPNTWHWFQGGKQGAVISEFSTHSYDAGDIFYDNKIKRIPGDRI